jgi:histidinol-phosphatase (PHP family)
MNPQADLPHVATAIQTRLDQSLSEPVLGAFVYGSLAAGRAGAGSDIDTFVLTQADPGPDALAFARAGFRDLQTRLGYSPDPEHPVEMYSISRARAVLESATTLHHLTRLRDGSRQSQFLDSDDAEILRALMGSAHDIVSSPELDALRDRAAELAAHTDLAETYLPNLLGVAYPAHRRTAPDTALPMDNHVHSQWSWDNASGSMRQACAEAVKIGLTALAFTDHADFTAWAPYGSDKHPDIVRIIDNGATSGFLDVEGYWECLERCRAAYPGLRILSGIEIGEPHLFPAEAARMLAERPFERTLGSLHSLQRAGQLHYAPSLFKTEEAYTVMADYLTEVLALVKSDAQFQVLAHMDYPMRAWPKPKRPFPVLDFEEHYRAVLRALATSGRALEVNTAGPWPSPEVVTWWHQEGGEAVSFGSDAHEPRLVGKDFAKARDMVEAAGFRPGRHAHDFWRR